MVYFFVFEKLLQNKVWENNKLCYSRMYIIPPYQNNIKCSFSIRYKKSELSMGLSRMIKAGKILNILLKKWFNLYFFFILIDLWTCQSGLFKSSGKIQDNHTKIPFFYYANCNIIGVEKSWCQKGTGIQQRIIIDIEFF